MLIHLVAIRLSGETAEELVELDSFDPKSLVVSNKHQEPVVERANGSPTHSPNQQDTHTLLLSASNKALQPSGEVRSYLSCITEDQILPNIPMQYALNSRLMDTFARI